MYRHLDLQAALSLMEFDMTKYMTIYTDTRNRITDGTYKPGDQLPEEAAVCETYGCSRMTVKKAYDMLVSDGFIYRKQGQGSFVLPQPQENSGMELQERELEGFTRSSARNKRGEVTSKVLHFQLIFAPKHIAEILGVDENAPLYDILRVRNVDGKPFVIEQTYMAPSVIPGITEDVLNNSVYNYIENELGYKIASSKKTLWAEPSDQLAWEELHLKKDEPTLTVEQIAYLDNGTAFEYSISRHRYDLFKFSVYSLRR